MKDIEKIAHRKVKWDSYTSAGKELIAHGEFEAAKALMLGQEHARSSNICKFYMKCSGNEYPVNVFDHIKNRSCEKCSERRGSFVPAGNPYVPDHIDLASGPVDADITSFAAFNASGILPDIIVPTGCPHACASSKTDKLESKATSIFPSYSSPIPWSWKITFADGKLDLCIMLRKIYMNVSKHIIRTSPLFMHFCVNTRTGESFVMLPKDESFMMKYRKTQIENVTYTRSSYGVKLFEQKLSQDQRLEVMGTMENVLVNILHNEYGETIDSKIKLEENWNASSLPSSNIMEHAHGYCDTERHGITRIARINRFPLLEESPMLQWSSSNATMPKTINKKIRNLPRFVTSNELNEILGIGVWSKEFIETSPSSTFLAMMMEDIGFTPSDSKQLTSALLEKGYDAPDLLGALSSHNYDHPLLVNPLDEIMISSAVLNGIGENEKMYDSLMCTNETKRKRCEDHVMNINNAVNTELTRTIKKNRAKQMILALDDRSKYSFRQDIMYKDKTICYIMSNDLKDICLLDIDFYATIDRRKWSTRIKRELNNDLNSLTKTARNQLLENGIAIFDNATDQHTWRRAIQRIMDCLSVKCQLVRVLYYADHDSDSGYFKEHSRSIANEICRWLSTNGISVPVKIIEDRHYLGKATKKAKNGCKQMNRIVTREYYPASMTLTDAAYRRSLPF